jgi:hypothetical protein
MRACIISITAGLWVMISPPVLKMSDRLADINHICGPVVITFAFIALWDINKSAIKANLVIAAFLIIATLFFKEDTATTTSNILSGIITMACSLIKRKSKQHYGGGWKSLFQKNPVHFTEAGKQE